MNNCFFNSYHCSSRFHCMACRDIEDDSFRTELTKNFSDVFSVNFECPHGVPWGAKGESIEIKKEQYDDSKMLNIDFVKNNIELFKDVEGIQPIIEEYNMKIEKSGCTPCLRSRINRGLSRKVVDHITKKRDLNLINNLNQDLILSDGKSNMRVLEWKKEISNVI